MPKTLPGKPGRKRTAAKKPAGTPKVPKVPKRVPAKKPAQKRAVRKVQPKVAAAPEREEVPAVVPPAKPAEPPPIRRTVADGGPALEALAAHAQGGHGIRVFCLGRPGSGKTYAIRSLMCRVTSRGVLAFVHDTKNREPDFPGVCVPDVDAARNRKLLSHESAFVFRGDPWRGVKVSVEEICATALDVVRKSRVTLAVVVGELDEALTDGGQSWKAPAAGEVMRQGRTMGVSLLATFQDPYRCPREVRGMADAILWFHLKGPQLRYLQNQGLDPAVCQAIGELSPFEYLIETTAGWDGQVYRLASGLDVTLPPPVPPADDENVVDAPSDGVSPDQPAEGVGDQSALSAPPAPAAAAGV